MAAVALATPPKAVSTGASTYPLSAQQKAVAQQIVEAGHKLGATNEEIIAALSAAISESNFNPGATGDGGAAFGVFQQHPSYGDEATRRDPYKAATAFLKQLIGLRSKSEPIGTKVADVQRPAVQYRGIYTENLDEALTVYNQVSGSPYSGTIADLRTDAPKTIGTDYAGNPIDTSPPKVNPQNAPEVPTTAPGVYKALDNVLNNRGNFIDQLNPVTDARVLVARGMFAVAGITISVFGLILVVGSVAAKGHVKNAVGTVAGSGAGSAAAGAVETVAEVAPLAAL